MQVKEGAPDAYELPKRVHIYYYYGIKIGPQNHNGDGLLGPNSAIVVYMDPLRSAPFSREGLSCSSRQY